MEAGPFINSTKPTDVRIVGARLYFLPITTRMPLKFGRETVTSVTCARVCLRIEGRDGRTEEGWGETPLSVTWVWPSEICYSARLDALKFFTELLATQWASFDAWGHPIELGHRFDEECLRSLTDDFNAARSESGFPELRNRNPESALPRLAALVCCSPFDLALHDAFGRLHDLPTYASYTSEFMGRDLASFLEMAAGSPDSFQGQFPADYFRPQPQLRLPAWHLVGGLDPLDDAELQGTEPDDGYPVLLPDWINRDGLTCLKVKLRGNDADWDYARLVKVGKIGLASGVRHLTADFNCTVTDPAYVCEVLDRLQAEHPTISEQLLYVEQPFPYDLEAHPIDVHEVSARKPLFLDESAHDWRLIRLGRELGWTGVALKTCKTQSGALLAACWAQAHGMQLMVQDLTNPMLAQIPHCLLAAHVPTIMGVETNAMQFYPEASAVEARIHPGLFRRREGCVDLSTISGPGFGYRVREIGRELPAPAVAVGD